MIKLIFADDEALVRNNIARLIDWEECGFQLVSCASNGHELLEQVEQFQPELIISDINMPFIDGIQAAREIRRNYPQTKLVFLTGYNEIEYVQQAIDINVFKYLLKPITSEKLINVLKQIKKIVNEEGLKHKDTELLKKFYLQNQSIIKTSFLTKLLQMELKESEAISKIESLRLSMLNGNSYQVASLFRDQLSYQNNQDITIAEEVLNFSIYNIASEIMTREKIGYALVDNDLTTLIFCHKNNEHEGRYFSEQLSICLEEIQASIKSYLKCTISVGIGSEVHELEHIHHSYEQANTAMGYYREMDAEALIFIEDIEPKNSKPILVDYSSNNTLIEIVKFGNPKEIKNLIDELLNTKKHLNIATIRIFIMELLLSLVKEVDLYQINSNVHIKICDLNKVSTCKNINSLKKILLESCLLTANLLRERRKDARTESLNEAMQIIQTKFANPDLSIKIICEEIHISESYFRTLFKKEYDITFGNYLTQFRMEKAESLLLKTDLKNYQIAEKIGYSDPYYFSYCFKKKYGLSPNKFREENVIKV